MHALPRAEAVFLSTKDCTRSGSAALVGVAASCMLCRGLQLHAAPCRNAWWLTLVVMDVTCARTGRRLASCRRVVERPHATTCSYVCAAVMCACVAIP